MRHLILRLAVLAALMPLAFSCGGGSPSAGLDAPADLALDDANPAPATGLPSLDGLPAATGGPTSRRVSEAQYELLLFDPVLSSPNGSAVHADDTLTLDPALNEGLAWAVYALPGFPTDGTVLPVKLAIDKGSDRFWIGLSDYAIGSWRLLPIQYDSEFPLEDAADLIAPAGTTSPGTMYVAVIADWGEPEANSLAITTDNDLPPAPTPVINVPDFIYEGQEVNFNAIGSTSGDGDFIDFTWTFEETYTDVTTDPATDVPHAFANAGAGKVNLLVRNTYPLSSEVEIEVEVRPYVQDLLIIYNSDMPEDLDLVNYYSSIDTGRAIDPDYRLGLPLGSYNSEISRENYETQIRDPIRAFITSHAEISANIKYILLMKGVPHKIPGVSEFDTGASTYSSVDSELCLLYQEDYPIASWIWNDPVYQQFGDGEGFYLAGDTDFVARSFGVSDPASSTYILDYLVGRLSAYSYDDAKAMVDRSLAAAANATAWVVFDSVEARKTLDTMVDPVWPIPDNSWDSGEELLSAAGFNVFADLSTTRITINATELPIGFENSIIGYAGWGVNHTGGSWANGNEYILKDLGWIYEPGACFMSYESFNGTDFDDSDGIQRRGQGQISDFFRMGGTVAIGNAWEPFTIGVGDERWVFDRYLNHGDRWIEAAYKGLRLLSWQEVVVGDPLCRVVAD
ncbi:TIGR03790 family protein [bacterium]|nr:TIGR03790 family protein [bacterium]